MKTLISTGRLQKAPIKAHIHLFQSLEKFFVVVVLVLYTGGVTPLLRPGEVDAVEGDPLLQLVFLGIYAATAFLVLIRIRQVTRFAFVSKVLILLVGFAIFSAFWSDVPALTLRRSMALFGTTLFGTYLASRFNLERLLRLVAYACLVIVFLSFGFGLFLPSYGIMQETHVGAWRGVFAHKNQLGRMMAFSLVILSVISFRRLWLRVLVYIGRIVAVVLIFLSSSVTALVVAGSVFMALFLSRLLRWKSTVALAACLLLIAFGSLWVLYAWENADVILAGFGRDLTFTGRTQLWSASFEAAQARLWLGHGYSAFWLGWGGESAQIWSSVGWRPPTAHNGWLDLMLELGLVGTLLFALTFFLALYRAMVWIRLNPSPYAYWPFVLLFSLLMLNLTESGFLGRNSIFWALQVAVTVSLAYQLQVLKQKDKRAPWCVPRVGTSPVAARAVLRSK